MVRKNSKKWLVILTSVGLMVGFQGAAYAANSSDWLSSLFGGSNTSNNQNTPDQKQIQVDQALAAQFQQAYQNDSQALAQAYRSGNRQNIQNLQAAVNVDIGHLQANAQDLTREGVTVPYTVPIYPSYQGYPTQPNGARGYYQRYPAQPNAVTSPYPGYDHPNRRWDNGPRHDYVYNNGSPQPNPSYRPDRRRHDANWVS